MARAPKTVRAPKPKRERVKFRDAYEREAPVSDAALPARRRRALLWSMILVIPLAVAALGTGLNVAVASATVTSYNAGDFNGSAAWARAGVSLNPFDQYTPHYNLGTAYAAGDLLPEAVPELQLAIDNAPNPQAACYPRANMALTLERLGDRSSFYEKFDDAQKFYQQALKLWQKQGKDDVCYDNPDFKKKAENSIPRLEKKLQQAAQDEQDQQNNGGGGTGGQGGSGGGGSGGGGGGTDQGGSGGGGGTDPGGSGGGDGADPGGSGGGDGSDPGGSGGGDGTDPGGSGGGGGSDPGGSGGSGGTDPGDGQSGGSDGPSSEALGDKLDELEQQGELSDRERQNEGHKHGNSSTPW